MKTEHTSIIAPNKRLIGILLTVSVLLLIPFVAMKFTNEVDWSMPDFIIAGILLYGTGLTFELIMRKAKTTPSKIIISLVLFLALFLIWAELAVGIFGTPFAGN